MCKFELECTRYQGAVWNCVLGYSLQGVKTCSTVSWQWKLWHLPSKIRTTVKHQLYIVTFCVFHNVKHFLKGLDQLPIKVVFYSFFCHILAFPQNVKLWFYCIWKMHFYPVCLLPGSSGVLLGLKAIVQSQPLLTSIPSATPSPTLFKSAGACHNVLIVESFVYEWWTFGWLLVVDWILLSNFK
jgi:hypothetical protein